MVREALQRQLQELGRLAESGVSERTLETRVVLILERLGWSPLQIEQDVPLTQRGNDRADIVVRAGDRLSVLLEVKRRGEMRGADDQVRRYCMLLTPRPRLAFLTDGVQWSVFYASQSEVRGLYSGNVAENIEAIIDLLLIISPDYLSENNLALRFDFLDVVEQGLSRLSNQEQSRLLPCYVTTITSLLGSNLPITITPALSTTVISPTPQSLPAEPTPIENQMQTAQRLVLDVLNPPLRHSKMRGNLGGVDVSSWRHIVHIAIRRAVEGGLTAPEIRNITFVNLREEHFSDDGFTPVNGTNFSVQAMEANRSWGVTFALIRRLNLSVEVNVDWTEKANEDWRGKSGVLRWSPSQ